MLSTAVFMLFLYRVTVPFGWYFQGKEKIFYCTETLHRGIILLDVKLLFALILTKVVTVNVSPFQVKCIDMNKDPY